LPDGPGGRIPLGAGPGAHIEGAIIDKNCRIGAGVRVLNSSGLAHTEETEFGVIRDGIVVIPKNATLPEGWTM
jgi:glucose-1-phosphate adenylyltransferase